MKEILVAVDGSKYSKKIVKYACELAKSRDARIALLYVANIPSTQTGGYIEYARAERFPDAYAIYLQSIGQSVITEFGDLIKREGIAYEAFVRRGNSTNQIIETARLRKVIMIVVGLRGLHGVGRIRALGSVARRVLENAPCPVVIVPV